MGFNERPVPARRDNRAMESHVRFEEGERGERLGTIGHGFAECEDLYYLGMGCFGTGQFTGQPLESAQNT